MTVEITYAIAIAMLRDYVTNLVPIFQPMRSKTNRTLHITLYT